MSIEDDDDLEALKRIGRICALTLDTMKNAVEPGITTAELDAIGGEVLASKGARSAPQLVYDFPGVTCISINDEVAHGIPGDRKVEPGDLVNIDVSAELDGYFADTGSSFPVPPVDKTIDLLCRHGRRALRKALGAARAGKPMNGIGRAIEAEARRGGFQVITNLAGHGVGRSIHEYPDGLVSYYEKSDKRKFSPGLVVAIEPFLSTGAREVTTADDGWTQIAPDGSRTVQYEHTVVITRSQPIVVTKC